MRTPTTRARALLSLGAIVLTAPAIAFAQSAGKWSLCGTGKLDLAAAGQSVGTETFDVTCHTDGRYSATGRTQLTAGAASIDLTTSVELGRDLVPTKAVAKGTVRGQPFEQTAAFANGTATLTTNGTAQTVPYTSGAAWLGANIFYANLFVVARYDEMKGGVQEITVFPTLKVSVERTGSDTASPAGQPAVQLDRFTMRIGPQTLNVWRDSSPRARSTLPS